MEELTAQVESKRKEMIKVINDYGINSKKALQVSQELDNLITQWQKNNMKRLAV